MPTNAGGHFDKKMEKLNWKCKTNEETNEQTTKISN